nr:MAG TPA: hypothetical protein [Caudoviricetes sp.]
MIPFLWTYFRLQNYKTFFNIKTNLLKTFL